MKSAYDFQLYFYKCEAKKTSLINVQPLLVFPDQTTLYQSYTQGGAEAVSKKFNETFGTETNKVVEINFDNMGKLVEASGESLCRIQQLLYPKASNLSKGLYS